MFKNLKLFQPFNFFIWLTFYTAVGVIYFAKVTGSYALAVSLFSIAQITKAFLEVPSGIFSDTYGRRKCQIIGSWCSLLTVILLAIGQNYWILATGMIFSGASQAWFSGNNDALLFESLPRKGRKRKYEEYLGRIRSTMEFSFMVGGVLGGVMANWSYALLMWLSVVPQLIGLIISYKFKEPLWHEIKENQPIYNHLKEAFDLFKANIGLRRLSLAQIIGLGVGEAAWPLVAVFYNTVLPVWLVGFVISINFFISTISYRLSGWVIKKFKAIRLLIFQEIYSRAMYGVALIYPTILSPLIMALASIFYGSGEVAKNSLMQEQLTDRQRATMSSMVSLVGSVFYSICGVSLGLVADKFGVAKALLLAQVLLLPALWLYIKFNGILNYDRN